MWKWERYHVLMLGPELQLLHLLLDQLPCRATLSQESLRAPSPHLLSGPLGASSSLCCSWMMSSSGLLLSTLHHSVFVFLHLKPTPCSLSLNLLFIWGLGLFVFRVCLYLYPPSPQDLRKQSVNHCLQK